MRVDDAYIAELRREDWAKDALAAWRSWCEGYGLNPEDELAEARVLCGWKRALESDGHIRLPFIAAHKGRLLTFEFDLTVTF